VEPEDTLAQRMELRGDVETFTTQLTATQNMTVFPEYPFENQVYFLVQCPPTSEFIAVVPFDHL